VDRRVDDELEIEIIPGDRVVLSRSAMHFARIHAPEIVAFIKGESESFPAFEAPVFEGEQGWVEVEPGRYENSGFSGGGAEYRLIHFAHFVRPFNWVKDPRNEWLQMTVSSAQTEIGRQMLRDISTQDLWDALFIIARIERFGDGAIAANAEGMTAVANEIRRRLIDQNSP
jgi:hypothetical protein